MFELMSWIMLALWIMLAFWCNVGCLREYPWQWWGRGEFVLDNSVRWRAAQWAPLIMIVLFQQCWYSGPGHSFLLAGGILYIVGCLPILTLYPLHISSIPQLWQLKLSLDTAKCSQGEPEAELHPVENYETRQRSRAMKKTCSGVEALVQKHWQDNKVPTSPPSLNQQYQNSKSTEREMEYSLVRVRVNYAA